MEGVFAVTTRATAIEGSCHTDILAPLSSVSSHQFQIHLNGLIRLLATNLYTEPGVFVRELLQNGHDAIVKRLVDDADSWVPEIRIRVGNRRSELSFIDNGAGLAEREVHELLSTIGASDKPLLRRQLNTGPRADSVCALNQHLPIGRFGIGLLSGFTVADEINVITRSVEGLALHWTGRTNGTYDVRPAHRAEVGTTVTLCLREEHSGFLDTELLREAVVKYADVIGIPIWIEGVGDEPVNRVHAPWDQPRGSGSVAAHAEFWSSRFPHHRALDTIVIDDTVECGAADGGAQASAVRGVLGITDRASGGVDARGTVDLFVGRMFIAGELRTLLPEWATFVRGVVECDALVPNAARDGIMATPTLASVRDALGRAIVQRLTWLASEEPSRLRDVLEWHGCEVLRACLRVETGEFFDAVSELIPIESDRGPTTIRTYLRGAEQLRDGRRRIYYVTRSESAAQLSLMAQARGRHVFHAGRGLVEPFLLRYALHRSDAVELVRIDDDPELFAPAEAEAEDALAPCARAVRDIAPGDVRVSRFSPATVPVVVVETGAFGRGEEMRSLSDERDVPRHLRDALRQVSAERQDDRIVHLNANNAVLGRLASHIARGDPIAVQAVRAIYCLAELSHSRSLRAEHLLRASIEQQRLIELALGLEVQSHAAADWRA